MAEDSLKDFLRQQARSLDSLLELTPAKNMFGEDVSDQWKRKKQTPEQKKAARKAKLDPANWKSAKDVYDERAAEASKKRKREEKEHESSRSSVQEESQAIRSLPSKKRKTDPTAKQKKSTPTEKIAEIGDNKIENENFKKRMKKRRARKAAKEEIRAKKEARKGVQANDKAMPQNPTTETARNATKEKRVAPNKEQNSAQIIKTEKPSSKDARKTTQRKHGQPDPEVEQSEGDSDDGQKSDESDESNDRKEEQSSEIHSATNGQIMAGENEDEVMEDDESTATPSEGIPDILSPPQESAASSVSSVLQPVLPIPTAGDREANTSNPRKSSHPESSQPNEQPDLPPKPILTEGERLAARQRLQEHIDSLRSQRKADEKPPRSRAELLEQRKRKEEERKAAKKAQRQKEKEAEAIQQDEEMARRFSPGGSGSLLGSPRSPLIDTGSPSGGGYSYGRIAFEDGTSLDPKTLSEVKERKHKGPQDAATALKAAEAKQARLAGLDETKKTNITEKDMWLNAQKRAHGEKVRDNQSLLKKALKRQDKQKSRSGTEWEDRIEGVRSSQEARQKKRTENLQKRKDEKMAKKGGGGGGSSKKKVKRPGFEGSFRGRTGKGKK